jgi:hypothetical protein
MENFRNYQEGGGTGQEDQMQQVLEQVATALQNGVDPNEIAQQLVQMGIPQEEVSQIIEGVMQQMSGEQPQMQYGGGAIGLGKEGISNIVPGAYATLQNAPMFDFVTDAAGYLGLTAGVGSSALGYARTVDRTGRLFDKDADSGFHKGMTNIENKLTGAVDFATDLNTNLFTTPEKNRYKNFYANAANAVSPSIDFNENKSSKEIWNKYSGSQDVGDGLPHAQYGIPPGFETGFGVDSEGYDGEMYRRDVPPAPKGWTGSMFKQPGIPDANYYTNSVVNSNVTNKQEMTKTNTPFNDKNIEEYTVKGIQGLGMFNNALGRKDYRSQMREYNKMLKRIGNTDSQNSNNAINPFGNYTLNAGPGSNFQLANNTPVQDYGTYKYGGTVKKFKAGEEYSVSHEELLQLMRDGAEIEFL